MQESIRKEAEEIKKCFSQSPFPMMYPYMPIAPGMQSMAVQPEKQEQKEIKQDEETINDAALDFMDSFMGG